MSDLSTTISGIVVPAAIAAVGFVLTVRERGGARRIVGDIKLISETMDALPRNAFTARAVLNDELVYSAAALARRQRLRAGLGARWVEILGLLLVLVGNVTLAFTLVQELTPPRNSALDVSVSILGLAIGLGFLTIGVWSLMRTGRSENFAGASRTQQSGPSPRHTPGTGRNPT